MMMNNLLVVVFHKTFDQIKWGPYFFYISNEHFEQLIQYMTTVMYKSKHSKELDARWEVNTVGEASKIYVKSVFLSQGLNNNVMSVSCHKLLDTPSLYGSGNSEMFSFYNAAISYIESPCILLSFLYLSLYDGYLYTAVHYQIVLIKSLRLYNIYIFL